MGCTVYQLRATVLCIIYYYTMYNGSPVTLAISSHCKMSSEVEEIVHVEEIVTKEITKQTRFTITLAKQARGIWNIENWQSLIRH